MLYELTGHKPLKNMRYRNARLLKNMKVGGVFCLSSMDVTASE